MIEAVNIVLPIVKEQDMKLAVKVVTTLDELIQYASDWNSLNDELPHQNPLMSYEWAVTFFEKQKELNIDWSVIIATLGSKLIAILPLTIITCKRFGVHFQQAQLPFDDQTMSVDMLVQPGYESQVLKLFIHAVYHHYKNVNLIVFRRIDHASNLMSVYETLFCSHIEYCEHGGSITVPDDYLSFRNKLTKNFKSNLNKAINKANKLGGVEFIDGDLDGLTALDKLNIICKLEDSGWKGRSGSSVLKSPVDFEFYKRLVQRLEKSNTLYFHFLKIDGSIVAGNLGVKQGSTLLLWKLAYDDDYKKFSPGGLLMEKLIEKNVDSNEFTKIDLMTGESWYQNWNMDWRKFSNVYLFKWSVVGIYIKLVLMLKKITNKVRSITPF